MLYIGLRDIRNKEEDMEIVFRDGNYVVFEKNGKLYVTKPNIATVVMYCI